MRIIDSESKESSVNGRQWRW